MNQRVEECIWLVEKICYKSREYLGFYWYNMMIERIRSVAASALHIILLILLVAYTFQNSARFFFALDDFAWLLMAANIQNVWQLLETFFQYNAAGTYRPLTQEVFFFINYHMHGLDYTRFHAATLVIHLINTLLVYAILNRLKIRSLYCFVGAVFYGINSSNFIPIYWTSAITESGMAMFYLFSILFFIRFIEYKKWSDYLLSLTFCIFALMSKESAITIPVAIFLFYIYLGNLFSASLVVNGVKLTFPFAFVVFVYLLIRFVTIGIVGGGPYKPVFDATIIGNLWDYLKWALNDLDLAILLLDRATNYSLTVFIRPAVYLLILVGFSTCFILDKKTILFSMLWFVVALIPVLPYVNHAQNYYVNISVVALSVLVASTFNKLGRRGENAALLFAILYVFMSWNIIGNLEKNSWVAESSSMAKADIDNLRALHSQLPKDAVLYILNNEEDENSANSFRHMIRLYYRNPDLGVIFAGKESLPENVVATGRIIVILKLHGRMYDVTKEFKKNPDSEYISKKWYEIISPPPQVYANFIDFSQTSADAQLIAGWYHQESEGFRWMGKTSELVLGNFLCNPEFIIGLRGFAVLEHIPEQKMQITLRLNGTVIGSKSIDSSGQFYLEFPVTPPPTHLLLVEIELDNTFNPSMVTGSLDSRDLGIALTHIELKSVPEGAE